MFFNANCQKRKTIQNNPNCELDIFCEFYRFSFQKDIFSLVPALFSSFLLPAFLSLSRSSAVLWIVSFGNTNHDDGNKVYQNCKRHEMTETSPERTECKCTIAVSVQVQLLLSGRNRISGRI